MIRAILNFSATQIWQYILYGLCIVISVIIYTKTESGETNQKTAEDNNADA